MNEQFRVLRKRNFADILQDLPPLNAAASLAKSRRLLETAAVARMKQTKHAYRTLVQKLVSNSYLKEREVDEMR
jgi:hypothetical protein